VFYNTGFLVLFLMLHEVFYDPPRVMLLCRPQCH